VTFNDVSRTFLYVTLSQQQHFDDEQFKSPIVG